VGDAETSGFRSFLKSEYGAALVVFAVVLAGYVWTLAPTVTFWDAGEFLAAAKILGIPHPPGTPAFVMMANVWGNWFPIGSFAYAVNFMTAVFSAGAAACMFLVVRTGLKAKVEGEKETDPIFVIGGAAAAALVSAFTFTVWQNSNEAEVYMVAALTIAAVSWLGLVWRRNRGTPRAAHILLLIIYLAAFSVGNHLLALLAGPALIGYMWHVLSTDPLAKPEDRQVEWAQWAVLAGIWAVLIGTGLGNTSLLVLSGMVFLGAVVFAFATGAWMFAVTVLLVAALGASTYAFLFIRAGLGPMINEADPSTWQSLIEVIRREQYPIRTPTDNPLYMHGPDNPGRSLKIFGLQIANYIQYFNWQWANGLAPTKPLFAPSMLPFTMVFLSLGVMGANAIRDRDRSVFWLLLLLFLITGPGLVAYMNFKPGFSIGYPDFPNPADHEVRERDYFFVISFQVWGIFAGIGIAKLYSIVRDFLKEAMGDGAKPSSSGVGFAPAVFLIAFVPFIFNFSAASRKHGPEATLAFDFARDLLQTIPPYGIVFTNGDNDTFPIWYVQEVEEIRQDVSLVNLSLGNTDWYIRQLRDNPVREFIPEQAPWFSNEIPDTPPGRLHSLSDEAIAGLRSSILPQAAVFQAGRIRHTIPAETPLYIKDILMLQLIAENSGQRPIYWSTTAGRGNFIGLDNYLVQEGLALKLYSDTVPDPSRLAPGLYGYVDVPRTDSLAWHIYDYADLFEVDSLDLDPTSRNIAGNLSLPFLVLGAAYESLGDTAKMLENFRKAYHLSPNEMLRGYMERTTPIPITDLPEAFPLPEVRDAPDSLRDN